MKLENNRSIQLAHAREKLRMTGKSPRKLGQENKFKLFDFIYKNGHITATVAQLLLSRTSGGLLNKLSKQNWLQKTATKSGTPKYYYTLSMQGLEEIEKQSFDLYKYPEINQFKVNQQQLRHLLNCIQI